VPTAAGAGPTSRATPASCSTRRRFVRERSAELLAAVRRFARTRQPSDRRVTLPRAGTIPGVDAPAGWRLEDDALVRELEFGSFPEAIAFVNRLAELAESEDHHPDIDVRYRRVTVRWSTHSAGGVTERDRDLAARTSGLA
jgi:4a-hydroxytetrahydrobiopterin dehydratase